MRQSGRRVLARTPEQFLSRVRRLELGGRGGTEKVVVYTSDSPTVHLPSPRRKGVSALLQKKCALLFPHCRFCWKALEMTVLFHFALGLAFLPRRGIAFSLRRPCHPAPVEGTPRLPGEGRRMAGQPWGGARSTPPRIWPGSDLKKHTTKHTPPGSQALKRNWTCGVPLGEEPRSRPPPSWPSGAPRAAPRSGRRPVRAGVPGTGREA